MNSQIFDVTDLPFVTRGTGNQRHCFWTVVRSSRNDFIDARMGKDFARAYLEFEAINEAGSILGMILNDMIEARDRGLVARHFIYEIASAMELALKNPWFMEAIKNRGKEERRLL